jgi:hypothetical protein
MISADICVVLSDTVPQYANLNSICRIFALTYAAKGAIAQKRNPPLYEKPSFDRHHVYLPHLFS